MIEAALENRLNALIRQAPVSRQSLITFRAELLIVIGFERHSRGKATGTEFMRCLAAPADGFGACKKSAGNWHVSNNGRECRPSQPANPMTDSAASSSSQPVVFRSSLPSQADKGECFAWNRSDIPKPSFRPSSARPTTDPRSGKTPRRQRRMMPTSSPTHRCPVASAGPR